MDLEETTGKHRFQYAVIPCPSNWFRWNDETQRVVHTSKTMWHRHDHAPAVGVPVNRKAIKDCAEPYTLP